MARRKKQLTQKEVNEIRIGWQLRLSAEELSKKLGIPLDLVMEFTVYLKGEAGNSATSTLKKRRPRTEPKIGDPITVDEILDVAKIAGKDMWRTIFGEK